MPKLIRASYVALRGDTRPFYGRYHRLIYNTVGDMFRSVQDKMKQGGCFNNKGQPWTSKGHLVELKEDRHSMAGHQKLRPVVYACVDMSFWSTRALISGQIRGSNLEDVDVQSFEYNLQRAEVVCVRKPRIWHPPLLDFFRNSMQPTGLRHLPPRSSFWYRRLLTWECIRSNATSVGPRSYRVSVHDICQESHCLCNLRIRAPVTATYIVSITIPHLP